MSVSLRGQDRQKNDNGFDVLQLQCPST